MTAVAASGGYPRNLQYVANRLSNFTRNTFRLQAANPTAAPGQIVQVILPGNALVDLSTVAMHFKGKTTAGQFPRHIESLIETMTIDIGGVTVPCAGNWYGVLFNAVANMTFGADITNRRKILQNGGPLGTGADTVARPFVIQNFLGFVGSAKPTIISTELTGPIRLRITLAAPQVLAAAAGSSYSLEDIFFSCDTISLDDGIYRAVMQSFLSGGGVYEIPFKAWHSFSSVAAGYNQTTNFSIASQSIDRAIGCFVAAVPDAGADENTGSSKYFTMPATNLTTYQFNLGGQFHPVFQASASDAFALNMTATNQAYDTLGGTLPSIDSLTKFQSYYWCAMASFCHGDDSYISGLDSRGNTQPGYFQTTGTSGSTPTNLLALVFVETHSSLRCGAGQQVQLVL